MTPPADWIPPQFREFVTVPLTRQQAETLYGSVSHSVDGAVVFYTVDEIMQLFPQIVGVRDTRTGRYYPNQSDVLFTLGN